MTQRPLADYLRTQEIDGYLRFLSEQDRRPPTWETVAAAWHAGCAWQREAIGRNFTDPDKEQPSRS